MKITIDPRASYSYASWYIHGMEQLYGRRNIRFDVRPFLGLKYATHHDYSSGVPLIMDDGNRRLKVFIDFEDVAMIFPNRYEWADVYGMVNPTREQTEQYPKLLPTGPEFGITMCSPVVSVLRCVSNYLRGRRYTSISFRDYLKSYLYLNIRRRPLALYEKPTEVRTDYIFHSSTLWYNEFAWTQTNRYRGEFLKAAQRAGLKIEGGLYYLGELPDVLREMPDYARYKTEYRDFIYTQRLPMDDYIVKTKQSLLVFNTPAVCACHGWKLAEYLCMGKAIISSPLSREMPAPLVHGENIHFVESTDEIYDAIIRIRDDADYRHRLEQGARRYYEEYIEPSRVVERLWNFNHR